MTRMHSPSCDNNQAPILAVLVDALADCQHVLEIGSGTGQHSVFFAPRLPHLIWQTSELAQHHDSIAAWHADYPAPNLRGPLALEIGRNPWPVAAHAGQAAHTEPVVDAVFTSNTLHIMAWPHAQQLLQMVGQNLPAGGVLVVYGPFNYGGAFTSESNRHFDAWLKARDAHSGIRDYEAVVQAAQQHGLYVLHDHPMPANNRTLVFQKR